MFFTWPHNSGNPPIPKCRPCKRRSIELPQRVLPQHISNHCCSWHAETWDLKPFLVTVCKLHSKAFLFHRLQLHSSPPCVQESVDQACAEGHQRPGQWQILELVPSSDDFHNNRVCRNTRGLVSYIVIARGRSSRSCCCIKHLKVTSLLIHSQIPKKIAWSPRTNGPKAFAWSDPSNAGGHGEEEKSHRPPHTCVKWQWNQLVQVFFVQETHHILG